MFRLRRTLPIAVLIATAAGPAWHARAASLPGDVLSPDPVAVDSAQPGTAPDDTTVATPAPAVGATSPSRVVHRHGAPADPGGSSSSTGGQVTPQVPTGSSAPSGAPAPTVSPAPCPPPPPQHHDKSDHGYFTVKQELKPHNQFLVTLTLRCFDANETENATITFVGAAPTGAGKPVKVLSGATTFSFKGSQSTAVVDTEQAYLLDPTVLGDPAPEGWHVRIDLGLVPDESASRAAIIVLGSGPAPTPSVLPFHVVVPPQTLPATGGFPGVQIYALGLEVALLGLYLWYVATLPYRRPKHRA